MKKKFKYGDFIILRKGAKVQDSATGNTLPERVVNQLELWAVDEYFPELGYLNINRVLYPYPGAYCSWVHESEVKVPTPEDYELIAKRRTKLACSCCGLVVEPYFQR